MNIRLFPELVMMGSIGLIFGIEMAHSSSSLIRWSESPYHSGHIAYYVRRIAGGVWLMKSVERNADLDDVTEEDIEEGALNDDQLQALWGRTLEEAQNEEFVEIVAAWLDAPRKTVIIDAAKTLYEALRTHDAIMVSEPDEDGLLGG